MSMFETLWRPEMFYSAVDDGGVLDHALAGLEDEEETEEEKAERLAEEAEAAKQAEEDDRIEARAKEIADDRLKKQQQEIQQRLTNPVVDEKAAYRSRLEAIADESDPVRQEEMRMELAEERVQARLAPQLAHSASQGALSQVLQSEAATNMPAAAKEFIDEVIRETGLSPEQAMNPANQKIVVRNAIAIAYERGKLGQPEPVRSAARTPILKPAPSGGGAPRRDEMTGFSPRQRQIIQANVNALGSHAFDDKGKQRPVKELFSELELATMFAAEGN